MEHSGAFETHPKSGSCRTRSLVPSQAVKGKTLLLCLSARHRRELRASLGSGLVLVSCPLEVMEVLEIPSAPRVILDRCETCRSCCRQALGQLLARLELRSLEQSYPSPILPGSGPPGDSRHRLSQSERLRELSHYLELVSNANVDLTALASLSGVTTRQITRLFRQASQESPMRQIRRMRLRGAYRLIETTDGSIETIAEATGFADGATFRRSFLRAFGLSPGSLRRRRHRS